MERIMGSISDRRFRIHRLIKNEVAKESFDLYYQKDRKKHI